MPTAAELFTTYNPYSGIATQYTAGLNYIIANLTTGDVDDLVTQVTNYVSGLGLLPNTSAVQMEISSVAFNAVNSYINGEKGNYSREQLSFINRMTGPSFTSGLTVDSLPTRIFDIQQNIPQTGLSPAQQQPLFLGTMIAQTSYTYWTTQIGLGGGSAWTTYLSAALTSATANLPYWNAVATQGAVIGARSAFKGMIEQTTQIVTVNIVSALIAALTVGAGKVLFGWIQRIQNVENIIGQRGSGGTVIVHDNGNSNKDFVIDLYSDNTCHVRYYDNAGHCTKICYGYQIESQYDGIGCQIPEACATAGAIPKLTGANPVNYSSGNFGPLRN